MESYPIPAQPLTVSEETIKKSRFITYLAHTPGAAAARALVAQIRAQHPSARHHCWAWVAGAPNDPLQLGFSDDGEPSGTAGKPILSQLQGSGVGEVTAVVVRYYGGIMLGTGGLVKAYGGGVQLALKQLPKTIKVPKALFELICDYAELAEVERIVQRYQGEIHHAEYQVSIELTLALPPALAAECARNLNDFSRGKLVLKPQQSQPQT